MEAITDREIMIQLDGNIKELKNAIEKFAKSLENLEETKIKELENRVTKVEKWVSEWSGAYKIIAIIALVGNIVLAIKVFMS